MQLTKYVAPDRLLSNRLAGTLLVMRFSSCVPMAVTNCTQLPSFRAALSAKNLAEVARIRAYTPHTYASDRSLYGK